MPQMPLLYSYRRCPYAMRARMALLLARQRFQVFEVVLRDKPAALLAASPKGTVPVLLQPDGRVLEESWQIMEWALANSALGNWWQPAQSADNLALLACNDGAFKRLLDRYKYPDRFAAEQGSREEHRRLAVDTLLLPLEERLQRQPQLGGASACATDLALFPFVRQFAAVEPDWFAAQALPALQAWLADWLSGELFAACMVKLPAQQVVDFPPLSGV